MLRILNNVSVLSAVCVLLLSLSGNAQDTGNGVPPVGDMDSIYSAFQEGGRVKISATIYDPYGKPRPKRGRIVATRRVRTNTEGPTPEPGGVMTPNTNGLVWTPRVETIDGIDLTTHGKIIDNPRFNFESFQSHPAVIPLFERVYVVNLYGVRVLNKEIIGPGDKGHYLSSSGKGLPARVLIRAKPGPGPNVIETGYHVCTKDRTEVKAGDRVLMILTENTHFIAKSVKGDWVGIVRERDGQEIRGWVHKNDLKLVGGKLIETVLK